jgi:D-glycerate 3-kinase
MLLPAQRGKMVEEFLRFLPRDEFQKLRVENYYVRVLEWILERKSEIPGRPMVVGVNGPQGSGKSTLTSSLVHILTERGIKAVTLSIDDFYLTRKEQVELAEKNPMNSLLSQRGYPGTHDIQLGLNKLVELKNLKDSKTVQLPVYDKSCFHGQGDRKAEQDWGLIQGPLDIVFLEGWMLGFTPLRDAELEQMPQLKSDPILLENFKQVNHLLLNYGAWDRLLDVFLQLVPEKVEYVVDWRVEAEERMKAQKKSGMSLSEIRNYIQKFILAYEVYLPSLKCQGLFHGRPKFSLVLDRNRLVV